MTIISYAQNFEDVRLWRALQDAELKTYLDIGAQDPVLDSVSLAFYNAGWRGTHVEPIPSYSAMLRDARPGETVIEAAVSSLPGPLEFYEFPDTGLSTGKPDIARTHLDHGFQSRKILVPAMRLDNLLELTGDVSWMKIDVEGMEPDVLNSWGNCAIRPWILVIEATVPMSQELSDVHWRDEVFSRGYKEVCFDGISRFYIHESHEDLAERLLAPPNLFDGFQTSARHFSAAALSRDHAVQVEVIEGKIAQLEDRLRTSEVQISAAKSEHEVAKAQHAIEITELSERNSQLTAHLIDQAQQVRTNLENKILDLSNSLRISDEVIRNSLAQPFGRWQRLGRMLGFAGEDLARKALRPWLSKKDPFLTGLTEFAMPLARSNEERNPYHRANSVAELLSWHDVDFVRCAYVTVLGRQPDAEGERYYTSRLRAGYSRLTVLRQLRHSDEARQHDPGISGFDRKLRNHHLANLPLIGWLVPKSRGFESDRAAARLLRGMANLIEAERFLAANRAASSEEFQARVDNNLNRIFSQLRASSQPISTRRVSHIEGPCEQGWGETLSKVLDA